MSSFRDENRALIEGDYYDGAFGPSILLVLTSRESISWLRAVFEGVAVAPVGTVISLVDQPQARIGAALAQLLLARVDRRPNKHLVFNAHGSFVWSCTADEWQTMSLMIEALLQQSGHQYLTTEGKDDALVEVSYGEDHG